VSGAPVKSAISAKIQWTPLRLGSAWEAPRKTTHLLFFTTPRHRSITDTKPNLGSAEIRAGPRRPHFIIAGCFGDFRRQNPNHWREMTRLGSGVPVRHRYHQMRHLAAELDGILEQQGKAQAVSKAKRAA
jgi:hypothetical protein